MRDHITLPLFRRRCSQLILFVAIVVMVACVTELGWLAVASFGYKWLYMHSDDQSILRPIIRNWMAAVLLFAFNLVGEGRARQQALVLTASCVAGLPAMLFVVIWLGTWTIHR